MISSLVFFKKARKGVKSAIRAARTKEIFWKAKHLLQRTHFIILRRGFYAENWVDGKRRDVGVAWTILRGGLYSSFISVVIFTITEFSDKLLEKLVPTLHDHACRITQIIFDSIALHLNYRSEAVSGLLGAVSAVSGVFLGLYFTAVSIGAGQQLSLMHQNLRNLVVSEKFGTKYIGYLTTLTLFSFLLWLKIAIFGEVTPLSLFTVILMSLYLIAGFYPLGKRSFFLAEPSVLASPVFSDIFLYLKKLAKRDLFATYGPIEDYFRRTIRGQILTVRQVMGLALEKGERGTEDAKFLTQKLIQVLLYYRSFKQNIQSGSQWFDVIPKYENWLYPDVTKEEMLHNLGVISEPSTSPDRDWFEKEIVGIIEECLNSYAEAKAINALIQIISVLGSYLNTLAFGWDLTQAISQYETFCSAVIPIFERTEPDFKLKLQLLELLGSCRIDLAICTLRGIKALNVDETMADLCGVAFEKTKGPKKNIPNSVRTVLDSLTKKIRFEKSIEGKAVTQEWYVLQVFAKEYSAEITRTFSTLVDFIEPNRAEDKSVDGSILIAMRKQREVELVARLERMQTDFHKKIQEFKKYEKVIDLKIDAMPENFESERLDKLRIIQLDSLAGVLWYLYQPNRDETLPDFFGICFRQLVLELFNRLEKNDAIGFAELFHKVFIAAFLAKDRLVVEQKDHNNDQMAKARIAFEPITDILHLSGYAAAFTDFHDNPDFLKVVMDSWKTVPKTMKNLSSNKEILEWVINIQKLQRADLRMSSTSHLRFSWKRRFEECLRRKNFIRADRFHHYDDDNLNIPDKPLLKAICYGGYEPHEEASEWFVVSYVVNENVDPKTLSLSSIGFWRDYTRANQNEK